MSWIKPWLGMQALAQALKRQALNWPYLLSNVIILRTVKVPSRQKLLNLAFVPNTLLTSGRIKLVLFKKTRVTAMRLINTDMRLEGTAIFSPSL